MVLFFFRLMNENKLINLRIIKKVYWRIGILYFLDWFCWLLVLFFVLFFLVVVLLFFVFVLLVLILLFFVEIVLFFFVGFFLDGLL